MLYSCLPWSVLRVQVVGALAARPSWKLITMSHPLVSFSSDLHSTPLLPSIGFCM